MNLVPPLLLFLEAVFSFYKFLFPRSYFGSNIIDLILAGIFLLFAGIFYKKEPKRGLRWFVVIFSLLLGPGGFIGFGGLFAIGLAVSFFLLSRK